MTYLPLPSTCPVKVSVFRTRDVLNAAYQIVLYGSCNSTLLAATTLAAQKPAGPRFEISFDWGAHAEPITGRVYVALSRTRQPQSSPIQQTGETGVAALRHECRQRSPRARPPSSTRARSDIRSRSLRDIPAGDYWVQPFVNVYTRFARADGHTVWLHMDQWEGQNWKRSPGNLYGEPVQDHFDPTSQHADQARRRQGDSAGRRAARTRRTSSGSRSRAQILTKWWGQPIYLGATVLLPKDYDKHPEATDIRSTTTRGISRWARLASAARHTGTPTARRG